MKYLVTAILALCATFAQAQPYYYVDNGVVRVEVKIQTEWARLIYTVNKATYVTTEGRMCCVDLADEINSVHFVYKSEGGEVITLNVPRYGSVGSTVEGHTVTEVVAEDLSGIEIINQEGERVRIPHKRHTL